MLMKFKRNLLLSLLSLFLLTPVSGQVNPPPPDKARQTNRDVQAQEIRKQEQEREMRNTDQSFSNLNTLRNNARGSISDKARENEIKALTAQYAKTKNLIVPPKFYYERYREVLKDSKMELARLRLDNHCTGELVISIEDAERCKNTVPVHGDGSFFSFINNVNYLRKADVLNLKYGIKMYTSQNLEPALQYYSSNKFDAANNWWNIHFDNGQFKVGENLIQGIISNLGNVDLNTITLNSPEMRFLLDYQPQRKPAEAQAQNKTLEKGLNFNGLVYSNSVSFQIEQTYILRSILYPFKPDYVSNKEKTYSAEGTDIVVIFKVIGQEEDGSIILLWKELKKTKIQQKYKM